LAAPFIVPTVNGGASLLLGGSFWGNERHVIESRIRFGFTCYASGNPSVPSRPDDILVFSGVSYGHIAIVRAVNSATVTVI
jgi:hypothetical protein